MPCLDGLDVSGKGAHAFGEVVNIKELLLLFSERRYLFTV